MLLLYGLGLIFILVLVGFVIALRFEINKKSSIFGGLETVLFLVMMPKNNLNQDDLMKKEEKVLISQMEQIFANFLYLKKTKIFEEPPSVAFEIASQIGGTDISFYVCVPKYLDTAFEKYVQGVYPNAIVEKIPEDYTIFEPQGVTAGAYLKLKENPLFPISTYQNLEKNPLSTITNNLSKISFDEGAAIQVIIRPLAGFNLKEKGEKVLAKIREGKLARVAIAEVFQLGFLKIIGELFKGPESVKNKDGLEDVKNKQQGIDQKVYDAIQSKIQKQLFQTNIRIMTSAKTGARAEEILGHLQSSFSQFSLSAINSLEPKNVYKAELKKLVYDFSFRNFDPKQANILNLEELCSIYHFPTHFIETPYIKSVKSGEAAPPSDLPEKGVNLIGKAIFRGDEKKVYFASREDRRRHFYVIGQTGTGKTTLLKEMIRQDIENGEGVAVVDPHGELIDGILSYIPKERVDDVVLFEPFDLERPAGLNMLEVKGPEQKDFAIQAMIAIFYKLFPPEMIGPMFEHNMRNVMLTLMEDKQYPGTIAEIPRMFTDIDFQKYKLSKVRDPIVRSFWEKEMAKTSDFHKSEMLGYLISKVGRFVENEMMRNIIGQPLSSFDFRKVMDEGKILLINLSKGKTGEVNAKLLGLIVVSKLQ